MRFRANTTIVTGYDPTFFIKEWQISTSLAGDCSRFIRVKGLGVNASWIWPELSEKASNPCYYYSAIGTFTQMNDNTTYIDSEL